MGRLTAIVLGAAAGGGYPQWNCRCPVCARGWDRGGIVVAGTQCSVAVSGDGERWILLNASPDLRAQLGVTRALHPRAELRGSPIAAVVLTGGEVDQIAGLLSLRERQAFDLFGTAETLAALDANPIFGALARDLVPRLPILPETSFALPGGAEAELFAVPGKVPLYLEGDEDELAGGPGSNVGVEIRCGGARLVFVPGAAAVTSAVRERLARADLVLFDGTLFTDDEMIRTGTGTKTGRRMGHMPIDGPDGSLAALRGLSNRRVYIHLNNTNPMWIADSPERRTVEAAGWEVADDGMEIVL
jgi:pyrroloquinoline quinone biosynthesis protein B